MGRSGYLAPLCITEDRQLLATLGVSTNLKAQSQFHLKNAAGLQVGQLISDKGWLVGQCWHDRFPICPFEQGIELYLAEGDGLTILVFWPNERHPCAVKPGIGQCCNIQFGCHVSRVTYRRMSGNARSLDPQRYSHRRDFQGWLQPTRPRRNRGSRTGRTPEGPPTQSLVRLILQCRSAPMRRLHRPRPCWASGLRQDAPLQSGPRAERRRQERLLARR